MLSLLLPTSCSAPDTAHARLFLLTLNLLLLPFPLLHAFKLGHTVWRFVFSSGLMLRNYKNFVVEVTRLVVLVYTLPDVLRLLGWAADAFEGQSVQSPNVCKVLFFRRSAILMLCYLGVWCGEFGVGFGGEEKREEGGGRDDEGEKVDSVGGERDWGGGGSNSSNSTSSKRKTTPS